jgi:enterochelin esterase-like enzyme
MVSLVGLISLLVLFTNTVFANEMPGVTIHWRKDMRRAYIDTLPTQGLVHYQRRVTVQLPADYHSSEQRYRVIYIFDGESALSLDEASTNSNSLRMDVVHDSLVALDKIFPAILVAIPNSSPSRRYKELSPPTPHVLSNEGGELEQLHRYIATIIKPYIDSTFRTLPQPTTTGIAGCSWGGVAAAWLGYHYPKTYGMAAVTSAGLYADGYVLLNKMKNDTAAFSGTRFWFDTGGREGIRRGGDIQQAVMALIKRGWKEHADVTYYVHHNGGHGYKAKDWPALMPAMVQFMLWKAPPQPQKLVIGSWFDGPVEKLDVGSVGEQARALAAVECEGGYRFHPASVSYSSLTPKLFTLHNSEQGLAVCSKKGMGKLRANWRQLSDTIDVSCFNNNLEKAAILLRPKSTPKFDATFESWPPLQPVSYPSHPFSVGLFSDDYGLYIGVLVQDSSIVSRAEGKPWTQDGVEIRVDTRSAALAAAGRGNDEGRAFLLVALSPAPDTNQCWSEPQSFPPGIRAHCIQTTQGFATQIVIPHAVLDSFATVAPWQSIRINVAINDYDTNGPSQRAEWFADWRSDSNRVGSGMYRLSKSMK